MQIYKHGPLVRSLSCLLGVAHGCISASAMDMLLSLLLLLQHISRARGLHIVIVMLLLKKARGHMAAIRVVVCCAAVLLVAINCKLLVCLRVGGLIICARLY